MSDDDLIGVRAAAARLGVHENTVRNYEAKGLLNAVKLPVSGYRRFSRAEVERMRAEMWSQFAPATEMPEQRGDMPHHTLTDEDWAA
jgi:hypothetical protein